MKKVDLDKHKFDTRWRVAVLALLLIFAAFLQCVSSPMTGEVISLVIGFIGGGAAASKGLSS